jgi:hypothetical protein
MERKGRKWFSDVGAYHDTPGGVAGRSVLIRKTTNLGVTVSTVNE